MNNLVPKKVSRLTKILLSIIISTGIIIFLIIKSGLPHEMLKSYLQFQFKQTYNIPLKINKIEGNIFQSLVLKNISIHTPNQHPILNIPKLQLSYPPHQLIFKNKKLSSLISNITITTPTLFINRFKNGTWNFQTIQSDQKRTRLPQIQTKDNSGKLNIKNLTIHYKDNKGFGKHPKNIPFNTSITSVNGHIKFVGLDKLSSELTGIIKKNQSPVTINAIGNLLKRHYNINMNIDQINVAHWGTYMLPIKGYVISTGNLHAHVNIRNKPPQITEHPFLFDITLTAKNGKMTLPFFKFPAKNIHGKIHIYQGTIAPSLLRYIYPKITASQSSQVLTELQKENLINHYYHIPGSLPSFPSHTKWIQPLLQSPPMIIAFNSLQGVLLNQPTTLNGILDITTKKIKLESLTSLSNFSELSQFTKISPTHTLSGTSHLKVYFNNKLKKPTLTGELKSPLLRFKNIPFNTPHLHYKIDNKSIIFNIQSGTFYKGKLSGNGHIKYQQSPPQLNINITSYQSYVNNIGTTNVHFTLSGTPHNLIASLKTSSPNISLYSQKLHHLTSHIDYSPTHSKINTSLYINQTDTPLTIKGTLTPSKSSIKIHAADIPLYDINPLSFNKKQGQFNTDIMLAIPTTLNTTTLAQNSHGTGSILIKNIPFYGQEFNTLSTTFRHHQGQTTLDKFILKGKGNKNNISMQGTFKKHPLSLSLSMTKFHLGKSKFIEKYIPNILKPFGGITNATLQINRQQTITQLSLPPSYDWLSNYNIKGDIQIKKLKIQHQPFNNVLLQGQWNGKIGRFDTISLNHINTALKLSGTFSNTGTLNFKIKDRSTIDITNLKTLFKPWGSFSGKIYLSGNITQTITHPKISLAFDAQNIHSPTIKLEQLSGKLHYENHKTNIKSLVIKQNDSQIKLNGTIKYPKNKFQINTLSTTIKTELSKLDLKIVQQIITELSHTTIPTFNNRENTQYSPIYTSSINTNSIKITPITLYQNQKYAPPIIAFNQKIQPQNKKIKGLFDSLEGNVSGKININKTPKSPLFINANLTLKNGVLGPLTINDSKLTFSQVKNNQTFTLTLSNGKFHNSPFNTIVSKGSLTHDGQLKIDKMTFNTTAKKSNSLIKGKIPISELWLPSKTPKPLSIKLTMINDQINILSLLHPKIDTISNDGHIILLITGTLEKPIITAPKFNLNNTVLTLTDTNSPIFINTANITINQNKINIRKLDFIWKNKQSKNKVYQNNLQLYGSVITETLNVKSNQYTIHTDLKIKNTSLHFNKKNTFQGLITLKNSGFKGKYKTSLKKRTPSLNISTTTEYPTLYGSLILNENTLHINSNSSSNPLPPIPLDLKTSIGKNVFITAKSLKASLLPGIAIDIELKESTTPIRISGTLPYPIIHDDIYLKKGALSIINRNFELLSISKQKNYLTTKGQPNLAHSNSFRIQRTTDSNGQIKLSPIVNITALTIVDTQASENINNDKYRHLLITLEGPMDQLNIFEIDHFNSNSSVSNANMSYVRTYNLANTKSPKEQTDLAQIIMPELEVDNQRSPLKSVGETQINYLVRRQLLRPVEKKIASQVGLEDLQINYNFGQKVVNKSDNQSNVIGVNAIKNLSDNLFIQIKSNIDLDSKSQQKSFSDYISEIELTYHLLRNLSLNYSNGKDNTLQNEFRSKISLRFTHEF